MSKDYYKILGIGKNASKDDIKKAFRKLAHEHHPDKKTGNEAKFKEASEAYSVLGDDEKRKQYDTFGSSGSSGPGGQGWQDFSRQAGAGGFGGFDFSGFTQGGFGGSNGQGFEFDLGDIFGDFFGGGRSSGGKSGIRRGNDIQIDIQISFSESVFGVEKEVTLTKDSTCNICNGTGAKPNIGMKDCDICKGKGKITEIRRSIFGNMQTTRVCDACHGLGKIPKELCHECRGDGIINKKENLKLKIPAGIENGQTLKYAGKGESVAHGQTGDLYINVHISAHKIFRRDGQNLFMDLDIKLTTALLGGEEKIETLDGNIIVKIPEGITHGEILRVKEKGVPGHSGKRGDLMIVVHISIPKKLSRSLKEKIQEIQKEGL